MGFKAHFFLVNDMDNNKIIEEFKKIHNDTYDYSLVDFNGVDTKVKIICNKHGIFEQTPYKHKKGQQCKKCAYENNGLKFRTNLNDFISKGNKIHGSKYDYTKAVYKTNKDSLIIICPKHGEFKQTPNSHLKYGCKECGYDLNRKSTEIFIGESKEINGDKYNYSKVDYTNSNNSICLICPEHGEFKQTPKNHLSQEQGCPKCVLKISKLERELNDFIASLNIKYIESDRSIIKPYELDIYIPSKKIAIEFDGLYWHSEIYKNKNYHLNKTQLCEDLGIQLIHIFEDEWLYKKEIVKSRLRNILGLTKNKIYARKCEIREVFTKVKTNFLNENHIQGAVGSKVSLGLYYNNELLSLMTFGKRPILNDFEYELIRFCNKLDTSVIGGASRLLKHFIREYKPKEIISYADRRWSIGGMYSTLGFTFISNTQPNWFIMSGNHRYHRVKYQKHKLVKQGYDKNKTAHKICLENGLYRIYDCGTKKYGLLLK